MNRKTAIAVALASAFLVSAYPAHADGHEQKKEGESQLIMADGHEQKKEGESNLIAQEDEKKKEGEGGGDGGLYLAQEDGDKKKEGEGAEDGAADDEVHGQQSELAVGRDVAGDVVADAAAGEQSDEQCGDEVAEGDGGDQLPAFHATPPCPRPRPA